MKDELKEIHNKIHVRSVMIEQLKKEIKLLHKQADEIQGERYLGMQKSKGGKHGKHR